MAKKNESAVAKTTEKSFPYGFETMTVETTKSAKYHKPGQRMKVGRTVGEKMINKGWAKAVTGMLLILFMFVGALQVEAQSVRKSFFNAGYTPASTDTVTNGGTAVLQ